MYDQAGHWLGDYDATAAPLQQAIWQDDLPVGLLANGNQLHYIEPDHLGTPRVVIEVARDVPVWTWDAKGEAFGATAPNQNPDGDAHAFVFDLRFPGQRYDAASGLNYNYFRDYDTGSGRYVQSDPIGLLGGISTYAYVEGDPMSALDPLGLSTWRGTITLGGGGRVVGGAVVGTASLQSECLNGESASVELQIAAAGISVGSPLSATVSKIELSGGGLMFVDPQELEGNVLVHTLGWAAGGGASLSHIKLGDVESAPGLGGQGGWDFSASYLWGSSKINGAPRWQKCGCKE